MSTVVEQGEFMSLLDLTVTYADLQQRNLHPDPKATREELIDRVIANMRIPRK